MKTTEKEKSYQAIERVEKETKSERLREHKMNYKAENENTYIYIYIYLYIYI